MWFRRGVMVAAAMAATAAPAAAHAQQPDGQGIKPVSVKLLPPLYNQPLRFVLNEPAYIAAFVVVPGEGVRMIYPLTTDEEKLQWAGFHNDPLIGLHFDDDAYDVVLGGSPWSYASYGDGFTEGPRYLYVIASRWPLDVTRFVHRPMALQRTVGYNSARSFDSDDAFNALLNNVVSLGSDDSWDSDVYTLWAPDWTDRGPHSFQEALAENMQTRVVVCRDGSSQIVPFNWIFSTCAGDGRLLLSRPVVGPRQRLAAATDAPTVLPTIRGVRLAQRAQTKAEPTVNGFLTTAAGGVTSDGVRLVDRGEAPDRARTRTVIDEVPAIVVRRDDPRSDALRDRDGDRRDHRWIAQRAEPRMAAPVMSTPRPAPPPPTPAPAVRTSTSTSRVQ